MNNEYTPYHKESAEWAKQYTKDLKTPLGKFRRITRWMDGCIGYDYIKAIKVAKLKGIKPDPVHCWTTHVGVCQDISALGVNMLRAIGIEANLVIGYADKQYHAWIEAKINGKKYRYDHEGKAEKYIRERVY